MKTTEAMITVLPSKNEIDAKAMTKPTSQDVRHNKLGHENYQVISIDPIISTTGVVV